jgi:hypothetical protein
MEIKAGGGGVVVGGVAVVEIDAFAAGAECIMSSLSSISK